VLHHATGCARHPVAFNSAKILRAHRARGLFEVNISRRYPSGFARSGNVEPPRGLCWP
jgi:hypothetical protein